MRKYLLSNHKNLIARLSYFRFTPVTDRKRFLNSAAAVSGDGVHQDKVK